MLRFVEGFVGVVLVNADPLINWGLSFFLRVPFGPTFSALFASVSASLRSRTALHLEILALRHQLGVSSPLREAAQAQPCGSISVGRAVRRLERLAVECLPSSNLRLS
jgi:hypothetical protein